MSYENTRLGLSMKIIINLTYQINDMRVSTVFSLTRHFSSSSLDCRDLLAQWFSTQTNVSKKIVERAASVH